MHFNVSGQLFVLRLATLPVGGDNFFSSLLSGRIGVLKDEWGRVLVNRSPDLFVRILDYLQTGRVTFHGLDEDTVRAEASVYGMQIPPKPDEKAKAKGKEYSSIVLESEFGGNRDVGDVYVHGPLSGSDGGISHFCGGLNWANQYIQSAGARGWMLESTRSQEPNRR